MLAKKTIITALLTTMLAGAGGATALGGGNMAAGASAAYDLVAGFEIDASGAHELVMDGKANARAEAQTMFDEVTRAHPCDEYAATDMPENPADDLTSNLDTSASHAERVSQAQSVETGLVDVSAWGDAGAAATGAADGLTDATTIDAEKPNLDDACDAYDEVIGQLDSATDADADVDVPTRISHEEGLEAAHQASGSASALADAGVQLP